jgi:nucleoside diphosphate kinase
LTVIELGMVTREQAEANYAEHEGKPFYDEPHRIYHVRDLS